MTGEYSLSDIAAVSGADRNDGFGNGNWGAWIILFLIFGMFGWGGFGGFGGGFGGAGLQGMATRADVNEAFALHGIENGINGLQQGICDSTYAVTGAVTGGFANAELARCNQQAALMQQLNNMSAQNAQCCCDLQGSIKDVRYDMATQACDTRNLIQNTTRDIIDGQNANTRAILDFLTKDKISTLQSENQSLRLAASQAHQNATLMAAMDAGNAELIRRINPTPVPAYTVPAPYPYTGDCGHGCYAG